MLLTTTYNWLKRRFMPLHCLSLLLLSGCDWLDQRGLSAEGSGVSSMLKVETSLHRRLVENSMAVTSVRQPGILFGLNDSGNGPFLFAFDSLGQARGIWQIDGARNRDWEAAALGPCGAVDSGGPCLFIGDVGDNDARRPSLSIYRLREPTVSPPHTARPDSAPPFTNIARLDFRYPDEPHDVEAMYVTRDGSIFLITKRRLLDEQRRARPALIFRIPASAWDSSGIVIARLADSLPLVPGSEQGRLVTDAALSTDGTLLAVRTYSEVFVYSVDSATGLPRREITPGYCRIAWLRETQGEGIGWWWDQRRLVLTSEGKNAPLYVVACPLPAP
jgi:hypothetical protein